jgi:hypothetical protein
MESPLTSSLSETDVLILLTEKRCRQTVRIVQKSASLLTALELAHRIADAEYDNPSTQETKTIHRALHNNHLPRLDETDVVEYDTNEGTVRPGINFDAVMDFLAKVNERDLTWTV